ncbi:MAG: TRAP transporter small permease [Limnohabitans sp.]|nr:TRAP transporter small permease [Limnohabitans sp.]
MRVLLNRIYDSAAALAALFMCAMLVMVLLSIFGREFNFYLRGTDAYAGYCMAASGFLALAHTLKKGEHIRVTVLISRFNGGWLKGIELWALGMAAFLACLMAYYSIRLSWQSYTFHDISTSNDATPLWIPQIAMAVGTVVLAIAFIDELILEILGRRVAFNSDEALHNE